MEVLRTFGRPRGQSDQTKHKPTVVWARALLPEHNFRAVIYQLIRFQRGLVCANLTGDGSINRCFPLPCRGPKGEGCRRLGKQRHGPEKKSATRMLYSLSEGLLLRKKHRKPKKKPQNVYYGNRKKERLVMLFLIILCSFVYFLYNSIFCASLILIFFSLLVSYLISLSDLVEASYFLRLHD